MAPKCQTRNIGCVLHTGNHVRTLCLFLIFFIFTNLLTCWAFSVSCIASCARPFHHTTTLYSDNPRVVAKPLCRSACLRFSAACSEFITNDPVLTQLLGSSINCEITTSADLNTLDGGVVGSGWVYDGYSILKTGSEDLYMKEYDSLGGYRCNATDSPLAGNPFFPESTATFFLGGLPYEVECFDPFTVNRGCGGNQKLECPDPYLVSDRSGCDTCKLPCPSFIYETSEYRIMWAVRAKL